MSRTVAGRDRVAAATLALLLQLGFIAAFLHAFSAQTPPRQLERELTFFLPRLLPKPAPAQTAPRAPSAPVNLPLFAPPLLSVRPAPPLTDAPPAGLENFGRSLFGCAPENYTSLTPQQRALCPRLGEGVAIQNAPDFMRPPEPAKDEAYWQEQQTEARWTAAPCDGVNLALCLMHQYLAEQKRARDARDLLAEKKAAALKEPERPLPPNIGVQRKTQSGSGASDRNPAAGPK